jgi:ABC-type Zn uptake system ZnuABC Zn-binding protein ZnuA
VVDDLYFESLSEPDGPAPNYLEMMRHNVMRIARLSA